jgi:hypothetical protein
MAALELEWPGILGMRRLAKTQARHQAETGRKQLPSAWMFDRARHRKTPRFESYPCILTMYG